MEEMTALDSAYRKACSMDLLTETMTVVTMVYYSANSLEFDSVYLMVVMKELY